nr:DUF3703 domain-containing protein [Micromonospora aurantiaca]
MRHDRSGYRAADAARGASRLRRRVDRRPDHKRRGDRVAGRGTSAHPVAAVAVAAHRGTRRHAAPRFRERDRVEAVGQVIRLAVAGPGSALGRYPAGNTGRARVPLTQPMPIPADLAAVLATAPDPAARA